MAKKKELKRDPNKKFYNYKRRRGDRKDGWRVRGEDPIFGVIPHLMPHRTDSTVMFDEAIDCTQVDALVRRLRRESEMTDLSRLVVLCAAIVRTYSQYPNLNRFVKGGRIWARNYFAIAMMVKREMVLGGAEEAIMPRFDPDSTLYDVWKVMHDEINKNKGGTEITSSTSGFANILDALPVWLMRAVVKYLVRADDRGRYNKLFQKVSPFHASVYITDIGSTGLTSVFHHLYEFGTCSQFVSIGKKEKIINRLPDGTVEEVNALRYRVVVDERIVDGFYYAKALRYFTQLMRHPDKLLEKPEKVEEDKLV